MQSISEVFLTCSVIFTLFMVAGYAYDRAAHRQSVICQEGCQ